MNKIYQVHREAAKTALEWTVPKDVAKQYDSEKLARYFADAFPLEPLSEEEEFFITNLRKVITEIPDSAKGKHEQDSDDIHMRLLRIIQKLRQKRAAFVEELADRFIKTCVDKDYYLVERSSEAPGYSSFSNQHFKQLIINSAESVKE